MAELQGSTAIVPTGVRDEYQLVVRELDAAGRWSDLSVPIPAGKLDYKEWSILARAAVLKQTTWTKFTIPAIILAIVFADKLGLDIELGDVYSTDGRPAINAEGRIKLAEKTGRIRGIKTELRDTGEPINLPGCVLKTDLECTATIKVAGWDEPLVRKSKLSRWFKPTSAWKERPEHQLELNTVGHACRFIAPLGDPDDAPPIEVVQTVPSAPRPVLAKAVVPDASG